MNLCSNTIQATRKRHLAGDAEAAELCTKPALSHRTIGSGDYVRLILEDGGCGMDEAILARLFVPFFTTKEVGRGTGFGLSLVYAIIVELGGAIDVKSAREQGSTFTIYLPRLQVAPDMALPGSATSRPSGEPTGACPRLGTISMMSAITRPDVGVQV